MMKRLFILTYCLFHFGVWMNAQDGIPIYWDYLSDNTILFYPSTAGVGTSAKMRLTHRMQWFGVKDAPSLQTLSAHGRFSSSGVGMVLYNDSNGYTAQKGAKLNYAHHLNLSNQNFSQLSFGLSVNYNSKSIDESSFSLENVDPLISGIVQNENSFGLDLGLSFNTGNFYLHLATLNAIKSAKENEDFQNNNGNSVMGTLGYYIGSEEGTWNFEPSIKYFGQLSGILSFADINLKFYKSIGEYGNTLWGAISYRKNLENNEIETPQYVTPMLGYKFRQYLIAYTYTHQLNDITLSSTGFHQITLGFNFFNRVISDDCGCPGLK